MSKKRSKLPLMTVSGCLVLGAALVQMSPLHRSTSALFTAHPTTGPAATAVATGLTPPGPGAESKQPLLASLQSFDIMGSFERLTASAPNRHGNRVVPALTEFESETHRVALTSRHSDSELEDRASRPIQKLVQVDKGDTLMDLLLRSGVERADALNAISALREVYNPRNLRVGQDVTLTFERPADGIGAGAFQGVTLHPEADRQVTARRQADRFAAKEIKQQVNRELARFSGTIRANLFESAAAAGIPVSTLVEMIHALSYDVDFQRDIQPGDTFEVLFERYVDKKGERVRDGEILYASLNLSGNKVAIYRYTNAQGTADYYDAKGASVRKALLRTPVDGARLSSGFGERRHPILGYNRMHKGVDFAAPTGTPIYAAGDGTIDEAGTHNGYGYYIRIRHNNKYSTAYAHLSRFAQGIHSGKPIHQGQVIGYVGSTGASTGPHLHYEILVEGSQVNPLSVKFSGGSKLEGKEEVLYEARRKEVDRTFANLPESSKLAAAASKTKAN
jgi:murein DD-endopeptidase MepM/ murein hydrolase activator NlpD